MKHKHIITGFCALSASCLLLAAAVPVQTTAKMDIPVASANTDSVDALQAYADQVVSLVNQERATYGLPALRHISVLDTCAKKRSKELIQTFSHTRPDGSACATVLQEYGVNWTASGENIAYGYGTAESVMNGWMQSSGHRANILSTQFDAIGVGVVSENGVLYWTQVFTGGTEAENTGDAENTENIENTEKPEKPELNIPAPEKPSVPEQNLSNPTDFYQVIFRNLFPDTETITPCTGDTCPVFSCENGICRIYAGCQTKSP